MRLAGRSEEHAFRACLPLTTHPGATAEVVMPFDQRESLRDAILRQGFQQWRDFHDRFMELEAAQKPVRSTQEGLLAYCSFADPECEGDCCVLPTLESAKLELSKGPGERLKAEFEALAAASGKALGCPKDVKPLKFWLYSLFVHLRGTQSRHLFAPIQTAMIGALTLERVGGTITDVCEASAIFCLRLETLAHEQSEPGNNSGVDRPTITPAKPSTQKTPKVDPFNGLGKKKHDLSSYLESSKLTDRQRDCLSMKLEYELGIAEIARRLNIHRSTVEEHINAGQANLEGERSSEGKRKRLAINPGSQDE